jgi:twinkle protein
MDHSEINRILLDRFEEVCRHLLPNGHVVGNKWIVGGVADEPGKSLQITLSGAAAGRWKDFATGECGASPLWLWKAAKGVSYVSAGKEAKEWLGIKDEDYGIKKHKNKEWSPPLASDRNGTQLAEPNSKVMDYLVLERRLDPMVIAKAKVGETKDGEWLVIPFFEPGDAHAFHIKRMRVDRVDGKKEMYASKGTKRSLYGKHIIDDNVSEIVITEGEIDALSFHSWGIPAVSMPNGVSDLEWVNLDWEWLERFEKIYVCPDMDEPGRLAAPEICKRLGLHRCFIVSLPKKDANECLVAGIKRDEIEKCLANAKAIELDEIKHPDEYTDEVCDYYTTDWSLRGWETPWYPTLPWRVRKAEFTILSGFAGSGKTVALNQLMLHLVQQGCKVMDASLEIKPGMTLYNMTRCALGKKMSSRQEIEGCINWLNDSVFFLDCIGTVNVKRLLHAMEYARKRHGIDVFIIDSLFKCGLDPSDFGQQREFADLLTTFCNNSGAHVILVAHARKTQNGNEYSIPSKADVAGSSDLTNAAFNVIIWWRNKLKKQKLDEARQAFPPDDEVISQWIDQPDGSAVLDKQRFGEGEEAKVHMWFNPESYQFHPARNRKTPYFKLE